MKISDLYDGTFTGRELYIVGTGPSMRVFSTEYLVGKACILLNDACRYFRDLGPVAFSNHKKWITPLDNDNIEYKVVKARFKTDPHPERDDNHERWDSPDYYCYSYREPPWDDVSHHDQSVLWTEPCHFWAPRGGNVAHFAIQFCANAGASAIFLVGCDCCDLAGKDYAYDQIAKDKQKSHNYEAYWRGHMILREQLKERFGIPLLQLSPFLGYGSEREQYKYFRQRRTHTPRGRVEVVRA